MTMLEKINTLWPEIALLIASFTAMLIGLNRTRAVRRSAGWVVGGGLVVAIVLAVVGGSDTSSIAGTQFALYSKIIVAAVGLLLLLTAMELPDEIDPDPGVATAQAGRFDPILSARGEFFGFFGLSLIGAMLCAGADDLIWLFLALELTSLPTYVMVATASRRIEAPEAGVKYFFLGALSAAIFLYGFALLYGATGSTELAVIAQSLQRGQLSGLAMMGLLLSVVGICFKIAAVPMHFYAADVYQGAATPVTAFLAFVPKTAGFVALILLLSTVGWPLDRVPGVVDASDALKWLLWALAVATMFTGNVLALRQQNVKRVLAYSSIAHTGYMLVGLTAGTSEATGGLFVRNGLGAVMYYLAVYGVMNLGAFAVLAMLRRADQEAETYDDLRGLVQRRPLLAAVMGLCVFSLAGIPPLVGFWGKVYLFSAAISAGFIVLAVLALINSAIAAVYYLWIIQACFFADPDPAIEPKQAPWRRTGAVAAAVGVIVLSLATGPLLRWANAAAEPGARHAPAIMQQPIDAPRAIDAG